MKELSLRLALVRRHLFDVLSRFVTSSFDPYSMKECERDIADTIEKMIWLEVERDHYRDALEEFVKTFEKRHGPMANLSPWSFVDRFRGVLREGLLLRAKAPQDRPYVPGAPKDGKP